MAEGHFHDHEEKCRFFQSPQGCWYGNECRNLHIADTAPNFALGRNVSGNNWNRPEYRERSWKRVRNDHDKRMGDSEKRKLDLSFERKWLNCSENQTSRRNPEITENSLRLVTWNILSESAAAEYFHQLYYGIPFKMINWQFREREILNKLEEMSPQILVLQEVDHFEEIQEKLKELKYEGVFKHRSGQGRDGCAIFWDNSRFTLIEAESVEFRDHGLRDNVAQIILLESNMKSKSNEKNKLKLVVANIHVLFNPKRGDIKLGQVRILLEKAHEVSRNNGNAPVVVSGDFNSTPESAVYKFIAEGKLDISRHDRRNLGGQLSSDGCHPSSASRDSEPVVWEAEDIANATGDELVTVMRHGLSLSSAYLKAKRKGGRSKEPEVTSFHRKFCGTVDYIWHTGDLTPVKVLDLLPSSVLRRTSLPSRHCPSDHLPLVCDFQLKVEDQD